MATDELDGRPIRDQYADELTTKTTRGVDMASVNPCKCRQPLEDHCPRCGSCECAITRRAVDGNFECPGEPRRMGTLAPFSR